MLFVLSNTLIPDGMKSERDSFSVVSLVRGDARYDERPLCRATSDFSRSEKGKRLLFVRRYENFSEGYSCFMLKMNCNSFDL